MSYLRDSIGRDYLIGVAFGQVPGHTRVAGFGRNPDVDIASTPEDVWTGGGVFPWIPTARALRCRSTSDQDSATGTGISAVRWVFLDVNYVQMATVVVNLSGQTPVAVSAPALPFRINLGRTHAKGSAAAQYGVFNAGDIILEDADAPNTIRAIIPAGVGFIQQSASTVPAGSSIQIVSQFFTFNNVDSTGQAKFARFSIYNHGPDGLAVMPFGVAIGDEPPYRHDGLPGIVLPEKTDFCFRVTSVSHDQTDLTAAWLGILKQNTSV